jgi:sigma-70-like protein
MLSIRERWNVGGTEEGPAFESELLRAGKAGDREALEQLLARHKRPLLALCLGILGHAEDAEDAVQETFLRALRALPGFPGDAAFRTWLFRIAVNLCLRSKAARHPTEPWDEERTGLLPDSVSPEAIALRRLRVHHPHLRLPGRHPEGGTGRAGPRRFQRGLYTLRLVRVAGARAARGPTPAMARTCRA